MRKWKHIDNVEVSCFLLLSVLPAFEILSCIYISSSSGAWRWIYRNSLSNMFKLFGTFWLKCMVSPLNLKSTKNLCTFGIRNPLLHPQKKKDFLNSKQVYHNGQRYFCLQLFIVPLPSIFTNIVAKLKNLFLVPITKYNCLNWQTNIFEYWRKDLQTSNNNRQRSFSLWQSSSLPLF